MGKEVWYESKDRNHLCNATMSLKIVVEDKEGGDGGHGNSCHLSLKNNGSTGLKLNGVDSDEVIISLYGTDEMALALETVTFWKEQLEKVIKESGLDKSGYFQKRA
jgi:hypothetical protein